MATTVQDNPRIQPRPEFAAILKDEDSFDLRPREGLSGQIDGTIDRLLCQSGLDMTASALVSLCLLSALTVGGAVFVMQENLLTTALGTLCGFLLPVGGLLAARMRRQKQMLRQLPAAIDELARAAKTGRSVEQCLRIVAEDTPSPLGDELQYCVRRLDLGVDLSDALKELPARTGLVAINILTTTLSVHRQTGGDLVCVLERLSQTIRDRLLFLGRLRTATIGSRATATLMLLLPVGTVSFFVFRDPNYLTELLATPWGKRLTLTALALQVIGSVWIWRIFQHSQRA